MNHPFTLSFPPIGHLPPAQRERIREERRRLIAKISAIYGEAPTFRRQSELRPDEKIDGTF